MFLIECLQTNIEDNHEVINFLETHALSPVF